jgi:hypothetical protein
MLRNGDPLLGIAALTGWTLLFAGRGVELALLAVLFFPATVDVGLPTHTSTALYALVVFAALVVLLSRGLAPLGASGWLLVLIGVVASAGVALGSTGGQIDIALRPLVMAFALAWMLGKTAHEAPSTYRRVITAVVFVAALVGVLAAYQTAVGDWGLLDEYASGIGYTSDSYFGRPAGTFGHPVVLGAIMAACACLAVSMRVRVYRLLGALCVLGVVLSQSRSAYAALILAGLVMLFARRERRSLSGGEVVGLGAAAVVALAVATRASSWAADALASIGQRLHIAGDQSYIDRTSRIGIAWSRISDSFPHVLFGHGALADHWFVLTGGIGDTSALTFDNYYLVVWYDYGLLGVVALGLMLFAAWRRGGRTARPLVAVVAAEFYFFDASGWPAMLAVVALMLAAVTYDSASGRDELEALDESVPDSVRGFEQPVQGRREKSVIAAGQ